MINCMSLLMIKRYPPFSEWKCCKIDIVASGSGEKVEEKIGINCQAKVCGDHPTTCDHILLVNSNVE